MNNFTKLDNCLQNKDTKEGPRGVKKVLNIVLNYLIKTIHQLSIIITILIVSRYKYKIFRYKNKIVKINLIWLNIKLVQDLEMHFRCLKIVIIGINDN